jgi:hypothetical protein
MSILTFFHQKSSCGVTLLTPPFRSVLLLLQTPRVREKSHPTGLWPTVLCNANQHSSQFLVPGHVECGERQILSRACSLSLSLTGQLVLHCSGKISETVALNDTLSKYWGRYL